MSINVNWANPYADRKGSWLKGNLHTHTSPTSLCAQIPVKDCLDQYVKCGYDFVSISDHFGYHQNSHSRLTIIPGMEWNAEDGGSHTGIYSLNEDDINTAITIKQQPQLVEEMHKRDALIILNHPNWQMRSHYRREELSAVKYYDGIEIYNGVVERLDGAAISTDKWDYLLASGRRVLGFAADDSHNTTDIGLASIYVRAHSNSAADIMQAICQGNFFCSSGLVIDDISMNGSVITVTAEKAQEIQVRANGGTLIKRVYDNTICIDINDYKVNYLRFALFGPGSQMAWTQPFFLQ